MKTLDEKANSLISTSVQDAEITMSSMLENNPYEAKQVAEIMLNRLEGAEGQKTRIALVKRIIRKANKH
ncbi:hypothetical protein [Shewanella khirikhana]|uniref:Uncharacterized protein n=1 Tax=Shewanella khirikhana TaxID=1965282 RepID=A0ABM7D1F7_9GAMM|nr:hypothetical protein [Shewanella khirikhana]AZQ10137.1 hypothetical protein STH12_01001 [Shewanella khirikhana]